MQVSSICIKEAGLLNVEKKEPQNIVFSATHDIYGGNLKKSFDEQDTFKEKNSALRNFIKDPEEEDQVEAHQNDYINNFEGED